MGLFELHGGYDWQRDNLDPSHWIYAEAMKRLYLPGEVAQALMGSLKDAEPEVRRAATEALGGLRVHEAIPEITRMLEDGDAATRMAAVNALGKMRSAEWIERLPPASRTVLN